MNIPHFTHIDKFWQGAALARSNAMPKARRRVRDSLRWLMVKRVMLLSTLAMGLLLTSCAGYRVRDRGNPFDQENIRTLAIPMFINKSIYPGVSPIFTREIARPYRINIRLVLIKNPGKLEKELLASSLGKKIEGRKGTKIIFQQSFAYQGSFNRETKDTINSDSGGIVNYSKTKRYFIQTIETLSQQMARDFEDLVINVF